MQREGGVGESSNASVRPFGGFDFRSMFGGEDPFFTRPLGSFSEPDMFRSRSEPRNLQHTSRSEQLIIEEVDSDVDKMLEDEEHDVTDAAWSNRNPLIEHPEDQDKDDGMSTGGNGNYNLHSTNNYKQEGMEPRAQSVSFQRVTYGGVNGAYYTATTSRRSGNDGVTMEESTQANRTTGQARHRISRGIRDKGHSVTRKLDSDGKVDTMQTLHNLNEDELMGFEQDWRGRHSQGLKDPFDFPRNSGPLTDLEGFSDPWRNEVGPLLVEQSSREKPQKVVRINIE